MAVASRIDGSVFEVPDEPGQLRDGLFVDLAPFLRGRQFGLAQDARLGIAAGPGDERRRSGGEQVDPVEGTLLLIEADDAVLDLVLAHVVAVEIEIERRLELAGMSAAAGELALPPAGEEVLVDGQEVPPGGQDAFRVGLE